MKSRKLSLLLIFCIIFTTIYSIAKTMINKRNEFTCFSNMRRLGEAISLYSQDYDNVFPGKTAWEDYMPKKYPYIDCPSAKSKLSEVKKTGFYGYAINENFFEIKTSRIIYPASTIIVFESAAGILSSNAPQPFNNINPDELLLEKGWLRHRGGSHYLFADGHVRWYREREVRGTDDYDGNDGMRPTFSLFPGIKQQREKR